MTSLIRHFSAMTLLLTASTGFTQPAAPAPATATATATATAGTPAIQQPVQQRIQRKTLAPALYEIVYSARQNAVFVASAGGRGPDAPPSKLFRLNPVTLAVEAEIPLERRGLGLHLDDAADRLYIGNAFDASVTLLDTRSNRITGVTALAQKVQAADFDGKVTERYPHNLRELVFDKRHQRLFAPGIWTSDSVLYVMDARKQAVEKVVPGLGFGAAGVTLDDQAGKLYVSNMQGQLFQFDTKTLALDKTLEVAADQLLNLAFDRKKGVVLATDQGSPQPDMVREKFAKLDYKVRGAGNRVVVIDPKDGTVLHSIATGKGPVALLIDAQRDRLWVSNRGTGTVTVHDSRDYRLLQTFELRQSPNSLALDAATGTVFVTLKSGADEPQGLPESVVRLAF